MESYNRIEKSYTIAKEQYAELGVDVDSVIKRIHDIPISVHCWQGDDISGFENSEAALGGVQVTGDYPGKARTIDEFRLDTEKAFAYIPGKKKLNLHAIYLDSSKPVARNEITEEHFHSWVEWARHQNVGLDFNPTCFSHPRFVNGMTLSHPHKDVRDFWVQHVQQCRKINAYFGQQLQEKAILNIWIPDGYKDDPIGKYDARMRLLEALDECIREKHNTQYHLDVVESKLFGIGSESFVVGSHELYLGYALTRNVGLCLDTGHFHPTEMVSQKLSAIALYLNDILLHVSRPVRWDSDHVVILNEELLALSREIMHNQLEHKIHIGLDFFDASINRVAAWIIGARNMRKALLIAALEPTSKLAHSENNFDFTKRLVYQEEFKNLPWQAIWDFYCYEKECGVGLEWFNDIKKYEDSVLALR